MLSFAADARPDAELEISSMLCRSSIKKVFIFTEHIRSREKEQKLKDFVSVLKLNFLERNSYNSSIVCAGKCKVTLTCGFSHLLLGEFSADVDPSRQVATIKVVYKQMTNILVVADIKQVGFMMSVLLRFEQITSRQFQGKQINFRGAEGEGRALKVLAVGWASFYV